MNEFAFEWDASKSLQNLEKHQISFEWAKDAFLDDHRLIFQDIAHSEAEDRFFCIGRIGTDIITVRFTLRLNCIRIFGAGKWRKGKRLYEQENGPL